MLSKNPEYNLGLQPSKLASSEELEPNLNHPNAHQEPHEEEETKPKDFINKEDEEINQASALKRAELLRKAIRDHDVKLAKAVLKAGLDVKKGCYRDDSESGQRVSFKVLFEDERLQNYGSEELEKIENLLAKYGCDADLLEIRQAELRKYENDKILDQLAKANSTKAQQSEEQIREIYNKFLKGLQLSLLIVLYGTISGASGKLEISGSAFGEQVEVLKKEIMEGTIENIDKEKLLKETAKHYGEKTLKHFAEKVPVIGKYLAGIIKKKSQSYEARGLAEKLKDFIDSNASIDQIISCYSIGAVRYDAETIAREAEVGKIVDKYQYLFKRWLDQHEWNSKEAQKNLGLYLEKKMFSDRKIKEEDLDHLEEGASEQNIKAAAKFLVYLKDVGYCKNYLKTWSCVKDVYQLASGGKSVIIGSPQRVIFCFEGVKKSAEELFSYGVYHDQNEEEIILGSVFEQLFEKHNNKEIFIIGDNDLIATHTCQLLIEGFKIEPNQVSVYLFGMENIPNNIDEQIKLSYQSQKAQAYFNGSAASERREAKGFSELDKAHHERRAMNMTLHKACQMGDLDLVRFFD